MRLLFAQTRRVVLLCVLATATSCKTTAASTAPAPPTARSANAQPPDPSRLEAVPRGALCVSEGSIAATKTSIHVNEGGMRAVRAGDRSHIAELDFVYRGPSTIAAPLANGELRRQIGLKLHAKDTCNVIYVMWHVEPTPGIHVSIKENTGKTFHSQCGDGGYWTPKAESSRPVPPIAGNAPNTLRAELEGSLLRVTANGTEVWSGHLPAEALSFDGPAGVRSDNGIFDFELRVPDGASTAGSCLKP